MRKSRTEFSHLSPPFFEPVSGGSRTLFQARGLVLRGRARWAPSNAEDLS